MSEATRLVIDMTAGQGPAWLDADGAILSAAASAVEAPADRRVVIDASPEAAPDWRERPDTTFLTDGGLPAAVRLRDRYPRLTFLPRTGCRRASVRYNCGEAYPGEGFRVYQPDTAALRGYRVDDRDMDLDDWLDQALGYGFQALWLHGVEAAQAGKGLDLDMLERARRRFPGQMYLSGGATTPRHLENLRREGGCFALVIPGALAAGHGVAALRAALGAGQAEPAPPAAIEAVA